MAADPSPAQRFTLTSVSGPSDVAFPLQPDQAVVIGRKADNDIVLPDERVSRRHAVVSWRSRDLRPGDESAARGSWQITDAGSRHGVWVNGVRLSPDTPFPLRHADLIAIPPWTFRLIDRTTEGKTRSLVLDTITESPGSRVERIDAARAVDPSSRWLSLLLECASTIHACRDERALAESVVDAVTGALGLVNAALLRPLGAGSQVEVLAHRGDILAEGSSARLSRSLIEEARRGAPAKLSGEMGFAGADSIMQLRIDEAMCVPLMLGPAVEGFLYIDSRRATQASKLGSRSLDDSATDFIIGLAQLASLAISNLRRVDLEQRQARIDADMAAAGEAHRWILPAREGVIGPLRYIGESRPGHDAVGGDFFDVIQLPDGRIAVALGDVTGKGVAASILMCATQGFLHASLQRHSDPARVMTALNRFIEPRKRADRFITMWIGVFDHAQGTLTYVDAGHGYAVGFLDGGEPVPLREGGLPLGVDPEAAYPAGTVELGTTGVVIVASDGLIEQPSPPGRDGQRAEFGFDAVCSIAREAGASDVVKAVFDAVTRHAASKRLADDATAVAVHW